ncbi:MAG TPA: hypothetical protein V6D12_22655, partial [Candidatus Obscuribacterales bacterium]
MLLLELAKICVCISIHAIPSRYSKLKSNYNKLAKLKVYMENKKETIQKVNNIYFYFTSLTFTLLGNLVLLLKAADAQTAVLGVV